MRICLIGPGIMPIPPNGWGAVEMLIWDYYLVLSEMGHDVDIINISDKDEIVRRVNDKSYDFVHVHYDHFHDIMGNIRCPSKAISSHYPYLNNYYHWHLDDYESKFQAICKNDDFWIFASSPEDVETFIFGGACRDRIFRSRLGTNWKNYAFSVLPEFNKTLSFSKINDRKGQWRTLSIKNIDYYGKRDGGIFPNNHAAYLGELPRKDLNNTITKYSNFILLSESENTTPLVVKEALICGLGVVVSEDCAAELDRSLSFISVIPKDKMNDVQYIADQIEHNKIEAINQRQTIRNYGIEQFSMHTTLAEYLNKVQEIVKA